MESNLRSYIKAGRGRAADLARALDVSQATVSEWCSGKKTPSPQNAVAIERFTNGLVKCESLRPDDWELIWPVKKPARIKASTRTRDAAIKAEGAA